MKTRTLLVISLEALDGSIPLKDTDKIIASAFDQEHDSWEVLVEREEEE